MSRPLGMLATMAALLGSLCGTGDAQAGGALLPAGNVSSVVGTNVGAGPVLVGSRVV